MRITGLTLYQMVVIQGNAGNGETKMKAEEIWITKTTLQILAFHVRMLLGPDLTWEVPQ